MADPPDLPTTIHPKHAAMLHRLSHRTTTKPSKSSSDSESTKNFLNLFSQYKLSIQQSLSSNEKIEKIEKLEKLVAESSYFLPPYEIKTALKTISDLKQTLDSLSSQISTKKPFSFKNKRQPTSENTPLVETRLSEFPKSSFLVPESPGFRHRKDEVLSKDLCGIGEFVLSGLDSSEVKLKGCFRALFVNKLRNCKVFSGPVSGSVLIEEAEDCVFVLASHQIRIHNAKRCDFYLRVRSRPIIEDCEGVRFGPYCLGYEGIERDLGEVNLDEESENWGNVDDFKWLKGFQSPNWSVLPESERIGEVIISDLD